jgi:hypothetical protein
MTMIMITIVMVRPRDFVYLYRDFEWLFQMKIGGWGASAVCK